MNASAPLSSIARDAQWLAHRYDPGHDAIQFRRVARDAHASATFLTDEYLGAEANPAILRRSDAIAGVARNTPVHFIFHSAFCCSTLLARAFDMPGVAMGLKEPQILNDLVGWRHQGADPRLLASVLDDALALLSRPFEAGEATIIKPSNVVNGLAPAILGLRSEARALFIHAPLPTFLKSIAKKGMWGRLWVRELLVKQLRDGLIDLGFEGEDYLGLTDLQAAAVTWLAQHAFFARLAKQFPGRVLTLDSETLLARAEDTMSALGRFYNLSADEARLRAAATGPAFTTHSKTGDNFGAVARDAEYATAASAHAEEIEKVSIWAEAVAEAAGMSWQLSAPLLQPLAN